VDAEGGHETFAMLLDGLVVEAQRRRGSPRV
jgi:hypothetical protein